MRSLFRQRFIRLGLTPHWALLLLFGCISPVDVETSVEPGLLVAEGFITDDFGPHGVYLSRIAKFSGTLDGGTIFRVDDALVVVRDDLGNETVMTNINSLGLYLTPETFRGEAGRTYTLQITLFNGKTYFSTPQTISSAPPIDTLLFNFKKLPSADPVTFESGVEVYTQWEDPADEENFYLWIVNQGTFEFASRPDLAVGCIGQVCGVPTPKSCCNRCWRSEDINSINVRSDRRENGGRMTELAAFIQDDGLRFTEQYHIVVNQYNVSGEAFEFHKVVKSQLQIKGTLFDPPPANIRGNIRNVNDDEEIVIGFFGAYGVSKMARLIPLGIIDEPQRPLEIRDDCRTLTRSVSEPPRFLTEG